VTAFQTNLDIATLEFNKSLQVELQAYFNATKNTIVFLDMFTQGLLSQLSSNYVTDELNYGSIVVNNSKSFINLLKAPSHLLKHPPTKKFAQESADFISKKFDTNIGVSISGIKGFANTSNNIQTKVYLGFSFNNQQNSRIIQCNSTEKNNFEQIIHAVFGYLKMMFQKHTKTN